MVVLLIGPRARVTGVGMSCAEDAQQQCEAIQTLPLEQHMNNGVAGAFVVFFFSCVLRVRRMSQHDLQIRIIIHRDTVFRRAHKRPKGKGLL